jgi:hypothetical protein
MAIGMPASQHIPALGQRVVILIVEVPPGKLTIPLSRTPLICYEEVL